jgi:hypothetical protein
MAAISSTSWRHGMHEVTRILNAIDQGDPHAAEQLLPLVYEELRKLAAEKLAQERPGQTLQATALIHEAYIRLVDAKSIQRWDSRGHFFAAAAEPVKPTVPSRGTRRAVGSWKWPMPYLQPCGSGFPFRTSCRCNVQRPTLMLHRSSPGTRHAGPIIMRPRFGSHPIVLIPPGKRRALLNSHGVSGC